MSNHKIQNLIFDFGGVIMDINPMNYVEELIRLGCPDVSLLHESFLEQKVYRRFETSQISPDEFRNLIRSSLPNHVPDERIDHAWNLILGDIPHHRFDFLQSVKTRYRTFLLSNTNPIHFEFYQDYVKRHFNVSSLDSLFEKAYFSFQIGLYKPDHDIFQYVLNDNRLNPAETIFIDDMAENVEAARQCGINGIHYNHGSDLKELIKKNT